MVGSDELVEAGLVLMQEARGAKIRISRSREDLSQWAQHRPARRVLHPRGFVCLSDPRPLLPEDRRWLVDRACRQRDEERPTRRAAGTGFFDVVRQRITTNITVARSVVYWCSITTTLWDETPAAGEA